MLTSTLAYTANRFPKISLAVLRIPKPSQQHGESALR